VLIAQGAAHEALALLERMLQAATASGRGGSRVGILVLQALAYEALDNTAEALALLTQALTIAEGQDYIRTVTDAGPPIAALLVKLHRAWRRRSAQQDVMLTYVKRLLLALHQHDDSPTAIAVAVTPGRMGEPLIEPLIEPLTERERDVLRLLAAGRSNQEIAQQLVIALSTVKAHIHNIYGKLAVRGRTRAVATARELCLLEP
jgi:LuxR family maltose regulon positive regulatory protein